VFRKTASYIVAIVFVVAVVGIVVDACFDPMDKYSIEVVLNKPGIGHDIDRLDGLENVVKLSDNTYLYRSHLSKDVVVIVFLQSLYLDSSENYIAVKVEPRVVEERVEKLSCKLYLHIPSLTRENIVKALDKAYELGWRYSGNPVIEERFVRAVIVRNISGYRVEASIYWDINGARITIAPENKTGEIVEAVNELREKALNVKPVDDIPCMKLVEVEQKPIVDEETVKNALEYELKWLRDIGVVKGLGDEDVAGIMDGAKLGYAGWNSRLVYSDKEDKWVSYAEIEGAELLRKTGCSNPFNPEIIPEKAPETYMAQQIVADNVLVIAMIMGMVVIIAIVLSSGKIV